VDIQSGSPTWLKWLSFEISAENFRQVYVPRGYAHGICFISQVADLKSQCNDLYNPEDEIRIIWNDSSIGIAWPVREPLISRKDREATALADQSDLLPSWPGTEL
jgi:dTDP-4-dehydrorhamnose 3,5-epimerase